MKTTKGCKAKSGGKGVDAQASDPSSSAPLTIDFAAYAHYLEGSDMSEQQKREFLETLWSIIVGFVDLGFGVHPLQQACGQEVQAGKFPAPDSPDVVGSEDQISQTEFFKLVDHE